MAGSPWRPSWTSLTTKAPIVDYLDTCRFHLNSRTALSVRRYMYSNGCLHAWSRPHANSTTAYKLNRLGLAATPAAISQLGSLVLTLRNGAKRRGFVKFVHYL